MKKKLALLLLALVVLSCFALVACGEEAPSISFYSPTKLTYNVGESLDLTGSKFVITNADGTNETVEVTNAMLDQSTLPNMQQIGNYTVKLTYDGMQFSFAVQVEQPDFALADVEAKFVDNFTYVRTNSLHTYIMSSMSGWAMAQPRRKPGANILENDPRCMTLSGSSEYIVGI